MESHGHFIPEPKTIKAEDLFPDWGQDVDRRIAASEARIKFWVLGGVVTNLVVAIGAAIPIVFFMGQISRDIATGIETQRALAVVQSDTGKWRQDRMIWEARMESIMINKGLIEEPRRVRLQETP